MKAYVYKKSKTAPFVTLQEVTTPSPKDKQVLIRIQAVSVNAADYRSMQMGIIPKSGIYGSDISGTIVEVGPHVSLFSVGDEVFGDLSGVGFGGFAEYVVADETVIIKKPESISFEQAAALPMASVTALQALYKIPGNVEGKKIMILGSSGGVGTYLLQLAHVEKAQVTTVCSGKNISLMNQLGATHTIDYTKDALDIFGSDYDQIFAVHGNHSLSTLRKLLKPGGSIIVVGGSVSRLMKALVLAPVFSLTKKTVQTLAAKPILKDLLFVTTLVEQGLIQPYIEATYLFLELPHALELCRGGHAKGKLVITMNELNRE